MKYTFQSGIRKVTVEAASLENAKEKAIAMLDRRIERSGGEPPVGYDLLLIREGDRIYGRVYQFTLSDAERTAEVTYTTPIMQDDVDMTEMLKLIREDQVDPTARVVMIRELKPKKGSGWG